MPTNIEREKRSFFRMWPRALFHSSGGLAILEKNLSEPGVYVLYRDDQPFYIGKTQRALVKRLRTHALKPNTRRYNFWNYFSAFEITGADHRDEIEAILIAAMPTANSSRPKFKPKRLERDAAKLLNEIQALTLTGKGDSSGENRPEDTDEEDET